jgi:transcriptional regulator with XRE-family HTH domain
MGIEVLRRVREDAGLSGAEAARRIGVSRTTLWRAEHGVIPNVSARLRIALFYGLRPSDVWGQKVKRAV